MSDLVNIEHQDDIVILTLNRPAQKNALSKALLGELSSALSNEITDTTIAIIVHGAGGCFSAGGDLMELNGTLDDKAVDDAIEAVTTAMRTAPVPVIAAIDGPCMGGAFDVAVSCDVRIANSKAIFQVPVTRLGLLYSPKSIMRMFKLLGRDGMMQMLVLGERFDAQAALKGGIVSQVIDGDSCLDAAKELANRSRDNVRSAVEASKWLLNALDSQDYDPEFWESVRMKMLSSPEREEAVNRARKRLLK